MGAQGTAISAEAADVVLLVDDISKLQYAYEQIHAAITQRFCPKSSKKISTLTIGGGGYVYPRYLEAFWPSSRIDVAEIDPGVTKDFVL